MGKLHYESRYLGGIGAGHCACGHHCDDHNRAKGTGFKVRMKNCRKCACKQFKIK